MEWGNTLGRLRAASMLAAAVLCLSCGNGIWTKNRLGSGGEAASGGQGGDGGQTGSGGQAASGGQGDGSQAGAGGQGGSGGQAGSGGEVLVTSKTLDARGGQIVLGELTLDVWENCRSGRAHV